MHAQATAAQLPELFLIESRYRSAALTAELDFVATLAADIRSGSFAGVKLWRRIHELRAGGTSFEDIRNDPVRYLGDEGRILQN
jgi:hypothetical protein